MQLTPRLVVMLATPPLMWACNAVVGRLAIESIGPLWLNALRWIVAFALLLPLGWAALGTAEARAQIWERWKVLSILGLIGVGAYNALQYMALRTSTPLNVTLIASSSPVWTMLIGALAYGVIPTRLQLAGAVLSLSGVALVLSTVTMMSVLSVPLMIGVGTPTMLTVDMAFRVNSYGDYAVANALGVVSLAICGALSWFYLRHSLQQKGGE